MAATAATGYPQPFGICVVLMHGLFRFSLLLFVELLFHLCAYTTAPHRTDCLPHTDSTVSRYLLELEHVTAAVVGVMAL